MHPMRRNEHLQTDRQPAELSSRRELLWRWLDATALAAPPGASDRSSPPCRSPDAVSGRPGEQRTSVAGLSSESWVISPILGGWWRGLRYRTHRAGRMGWGMPVPALLRFPPQQRLTAYYAAPAPSRIDRLCSGTMRPRHYVDRSATPLRRKSTQMRGKPANMPSAPISIAVRRPKMSPTAPNPIAALERMAKFIDR